MYKCVEKNLILRSISISKYVVMKTGILDMFTRNAC